ncbi:hypothetical protein EYZ11_001184 [Aspergillus tanneri]|uniref:Uncharacterized protein n=1 Tax=Aspergillus tanneri TaxID=1220188 RepID=A0A4S3JVB5_9EURO|nr:hypothetical protein EYZ11_001184 [Aspergillus tanneri]
MATGGNLLRGIDLPTLYRDWNTGGVLLRQWRSDRVMQLWGSVGL